MLLLFVFGFFHIYTPILYLTSSIFSFAAELDELSIELLPLLENHLHKKIPHLNELIMKSFDGVQNTEVIEQ